MEAEVGVYCAFCGVSEVGDVKLKDCDGDCCLVKYCSDNCQEYHREQHEEECKKWLALLAKLRLRDRSLFTQPKRSHLGDCPICCLPLSIDGSRGRKFKMMTCCSKTICIGCDFANYKRGFEEGLDDRCLLCREPAANFKKDEDENRMKRVKNNCPVAMREVGKEHHLEENYETALEYYTKAVELGDVEAHFHLSFLYKDGDGVEKDAQQELYHLEQAAIGGHPSARHNLGCEETNNKRYDRAREHFIIAANLGHDGSLDALRLFNAKGLACQGVYTAAHRGYQAAVDATKSYEREIAENLATAIRDDNDLFTQTESSDLGDCPICCLPMPLGAEKILFMACCSKSICHGCDYVNHKREIKARLEHRCAFCREPESKSDEEVDKRLMERVKKNDPFAMRHMGRQLCKRGDYNAAFDYGKKAAALGDAGAHYDLSCMYNKGVGVEKDIKKQIYHTEEAAIRGDLDARHNLGSLEAGCGTVERAKKHYTIAANLGYHESLKELRILYADAKVSKEDYASALRGYQAAVEAMKSVDREKAQEAVKNGEIRKKF